MRSRHRERHRTQNVGWLRAAVLGANDGIVSTASLVLGVAAAHGTHSSVLVVGVAGLVAGAMSMAAGEYISVHAQADTEQADLERESAELAADRGAEQSELTAIYEAVVWILRLQDRWPLNSWRMTPWARTPATNSVSRNLSWQ